MATMTHQVKMYEVPSGVIVQACRHCGGQIIWMKSYKPGGKNYPVDVVIQNGREYTARNLFHKCTAPQQMSLPQVKQTFNARGILDLFDKAIQHLQYPKINLQTKSGQPVQLYRSGPQAKHPGHIRVTDGGRYGFNKNFGRLAPDGNWFEGSHSHPELVQLLDELSKDPAGVAAAYGKLTGNCCFCHKKLSDERSTEVGYGKTCAGHYGLPWGTVTPSPAPVPQPVAHAVGTRIGPWTKGSATTWVAEASSIGDNPGACPLCRNAQHNWSTHKDNERDTLYWDATCTCGAELRIFND